MLLLGTLFPEKLWPERAAATGGRPSHASCSLILSAWYYPGFVTACYLRKHSIPGQEGSCPPRHPEDFSGVLTVHTVSPPVLAVSPLHSPCPSLCPLSCALSLHVPSPGVRAFPTIFYVDLASPEAQAAESQTQSSKPRDSGMSSGFLGTLLALCVCLVAGGMCKQTGGHYHRVTS